MALKARAASARSSGDWGPAKSSAKPFPSGRGQPIKAHVCKSPAGRQFVRLQVFRRRVGNEDGNVVLRGPVRGLVSLHDLAQLTSEAIGPQIASPRDFRAQQDQL